jgi:hypothetical protein
LAGNRGQMPLSVRGAQATQDFLPVIGDALALGEAGEAFSRGELAAAGLLGAGAAIGLVPAAGDALAKPVMAAGRRATDIARRIEVAPNALGSMGGNIRLRPSMSALDTVDMPAHSRPEYSGAAVNRTTPYPRYTPKSTPERMARLEARVADPNDPIRGMFDNYIERGRNLGGEDWYNTEELRWRSAVA